MRISFDLPSELVQVIDTENYKGVPVTVLRMFGEDVLYYHGRDMRNHPYQLENSDWEDVFKRLLTEFFATLFMDNTSVARDWGKENHTGRELRDSSHDAIHYVRED